MIKIIPRGEPFVAGNIYFEDGSGLSSNCPRCGAYNVVTKIDRPHFDEPTPVNFVCWELHPDWPAEKNVCCDMEWTEWVRLEVKITATPTTPPDIKSKKSKPTLVYSPV